MGRGRPRKTTTEARRHAGLAEVAAVATDYPAAILAAVDARGGCGRGEVRRHLGISDKAIGEHFTRARGRPPGPAS